MCINNLNELYIFNLKNSIEFVYFLYKKLFYELCAFKKYTKSIRNLYGKNQYEIYTF